MNTYHVYLLSTCLTLTVCGTTKLPDIPKNSENSIYVETSLGDFIDKITILQIKKERIQDSAKLVNIWTELDCLMNMYHTHVQPSEELDDLTDQLLTVNKNLWDLEDAVRLKEKNQCFNEDFVHHVDAILTNNDRRACIKRSINLLGGSRIIEEKSYKHIHAIEFKKSTMLEPTTQPIALAVATPLGDLVDRITILMIKTMRINDPQKLSNIATELKALKDILASHISSCPKFDALQEELLKANEAMWEIQDAIRIKKYAAQFDDEFILLGRSVYYTNDKRCAIKRTINERFGSQLLEEKCYTNY